MGNKRKDFSTMDLTSDAKEKQNEAPDLFLTAEGISIPKTASAPKRAAITSWVFCRDPTLFKRPLQFHVCSSSVDH